MLHFVCCFFFVLFFCGMKQGAKQHNALGEICGGILILIVNSESWLILTMLKKREKKNYFLPKLPEALVSMDIREGAFPSIISGCCIEIR